MKSQDSFQNSRRNKYKWQLKKVVGCLKIYLFVLRCSTKSKIDAFSSSQKRRGLERQTGETPETDVSQGSGVASIIRKVSEQTGVVALTLKCHLQEQDNELSPSKPGKAESDKIFPEDLLEKTWISGKSSLSR